MQQTIKGRAISWLAFFLMSILLTAALPPSLAHAGAMVQWRRGNGDCGRSGCKVLYWRLC